MKPTLRFYTAPWCVACVPIKVFVKDVCLLTGHNLDIIDVDKNPELGEGITTLPTFKVGDRVATGAMTRFTLKQFLEATP